MFETIGNALPLTRKNLADQIARKNKWLDKGFVQVRNKMIRDTSVSTTGRLLYTLLQSRSFSGNSPYPGQATLAKELGLSVRSVFNYLEELENAGWLTSKKRGLNKTNVYHLRKYPVPRLFDPSHDK